MKLLQKGTKLVDDGMDGEIVDVKLGDNTVWYEIQVRERNPVGLEDTYTFTINHQDLHGGIRDGITVIK